VLLVIGFDDIVAAADAVPDILPFRAHGLIALEGLGDELITSMKRKHFRTEDLRLLPEGDGWLMAQFGAATIEEATAQAERLQSHLRGRARDQRLVSDPDQRDRLWKVREAGLGSASWVPGMPDTWPGWEDSAVAPEALGAYMRDLKALMGRFGYGGAMYGHFGDGLIHVRVGFGLHSEDEVRRFRAFEEAAAALVVRHGGSLSGEHGDGRARAELLPVMFGERLMTAFAEFKRLWDPAGRMNPGKIVLPKKLDTDLRYGPAFEARKPRYHTLLKFPESENSFGRAVMRCVGVGECRRHSGGTMCPSFRGTHEEKHSTRGRSRLLQEMLEGGPIDDGFASRAVHNALDLCLSCKACKSECPVGVDMAAYRAEFLSHYYQSHARPVASYSMGLVHVWAPVAARMPWLANGLTQAPGLRAVAKAIAGVHPARSLPPLARQTFRRSWRPSGATRSARAVLWADTFNNHFTPGPLMAAAQVLERSGHEVIVSPPGLCCGRPFYDFGRLEPARHYLAKILDRLMPLIDDRTWLVAIEPSCLSVFHDELLRFFPDDPRAHLLSERTLSLAGFLQRHGHAPLCFDQEVAVHGHCHQTSVNGTEAEMAVLASAGQQVRLLDDGCCGMAGAFGYEQAKYAVSEAIARQGIVPHLAALSSHTVVVADGFSCRHQIGHFTGRNAVTLPELLLEAMA
jgi:Fe-S oxidoreductase